MTAPPEAVLYAAKSTEDEHGSIPTQLEDCRKGAEAEGREIVGTYSDEAKSGYSGNRGPELVAAMEHAERIGGELWVQHTDRLGRGDGKQSKHLVEYVLWSWKSGVRLRSVQDDDACGDLLYAVVNGQRNHEDSARKSAATRSGKRRAWERGDFPGGIVPDGFVVEGRGDARTITLDRARIKLIRRIGELADDGWTDGSIARELNRRGHRSKGRNVWTRARVKEVLTDPIRYGGVVWHKGQNDEEVNWSTDFPTVWSRADYERRMSGRPAPSTPRKTGRPNSNHALAGMARCLRCGRRMDMATSSYKRKDGSRKRTYVCANVHDATGMCDMPRLDAEIIDSHVVNGLQCYLGDFEAWRDQLLTDYSSERDQLQREVQDARSDLMAQERLCARLDDRIGLAETESEAKSVMRAAARAHDELERRGRRLRAAQDALSDVPDEAPADAMLDFYNQLSEAVKGRLAGAKTIARVNEALKDIFSSFYLEHVNEGIRITPVLHAPVGFLDMDRGERGEFYGQGRDPSTATTPEPIVPPLRTIRATAALSGAGSLSASGQVHPEGNIPSRW